MLKSIATLLCISFGLFCAPLSAASSEESPVIKTAEEMAITDADMTLGNADAPVTVVEYASLSCPHCAAFHNETFPTIKEQYVDTGKVRFIFRDFPFNAPALHGAMLAHCAGKDQYFNFLKVLFRTQNDWAFDSDNYLAKLKNTGKLGGVTEEKFDACLKDANLELGLIKGKQYAIEKLGMKATPSFFVNGRLYSGNMPLKMFSKALDDAVAAATSSPAPKPAAPANGS